MLEQFERLTEEAERNKWEGLQVLVLMHELLFGLL